MSPPALPSPGGARGCWFLSDLASGDPHTALRRCERGAGRMLVAVAMQVLVGGRGARCAAWVGRPARRSANYGLI